MFSLCTGDLYFFAEHLQGCLIVRLVGYLFHNVAEYYATVLVKYEDGTCEKSGTGDP